MSVKKIFYNASLPRSGSTLLQNVMMQNPEIYSTPTSGVIELLLSSRTLYSNGDAFKAQDQEEMKSAFRGFCKGGIYGYFNSITDRPYVMEKSRGWLGNRSFIDFFDEDPKIVVMIRDLRSIFSSMEKNFRKNPHKDPLIVNGAELKNMTTPSRIDHYSVTPPVGTSLEWLFESIHQGYDKKIHFVKFEDFTVNPDKEMKKIYNYLDIPYFQHDFNNVEQLTKENDVIHGIFGDHTIQKEVKSIPEDYVNILGKTESDRLRLHYDWFYQRFNYI
jgi:sulfotransferase